MFVDDTKKPGGEGKSISMKEVYKHMTFDVCDPIRDAIGLPRSVPDGPPEFIPPPRFSKTRKSEVLLFDSTNMGKLHVHREVNRTISCTANASAITGIGSMGADTDNSRATSVSGDTDTNTSVSFEEFARIPQNIIPVLKDGVLAFRNGQLVSLPSKSY